MNVEVSRRQFMRGAAAGVAGTSLGALGFGDIATAYASSIRAWKLLGTTENSQHLHLLRSGLRHHHVFER